MPSFHPWLGWVWCSYACCPKPDDENSHFLMIVDGSRAGGRDWSSLKGQVICDTCYVRFKESGSLDVADSSSSSSSSSSSASTTAKRCSYECCTSANASSQLLKIQTGTSAGGQDWTSLVGRVLCHECYDRFKSHGSLERGTGPRSKPLSAEEKRCGYEDCLSPDKSNKFYQITDTTEAGGQDWTSLIGRVLCRACYGRFKSHGSLEGGTGPRSKPLSAEEKRCGYEDCLSPDKSNKFYQITDTTEAGGQDWTSLVGGVLCRACYDRFRSHGSLERGTGPRSKPLSAEEKRCGYEDCLSPDQSSRFYQITDTTDAGGQDWSSLTGQLLCDTCYHRFCRNGSLHQQISTSTKRQKTSTSTKSSTPADTSLVNTRKTSRSSVEGREEEVSECMICLGESRTMCIVPCGHYGLCAECGDEDKFNSDERPYSNCPTCREEMCKPYVMSREMWEACGKRVFDTLL